MTDAEIRALRPKDKPYKVRVERGLYIHVQPGGSRLWRFRYVGRDGVDHTLSLGDYPRVTLADARRKAQTAHNARRDGKDPAVLKAARSHTLEAVAREWFNIQRPRWKPHHAADVLARMEADAFPVIGKLLIDEVTAPDVLRVIRAIEPRSVDLARRMRQRLDAVFSYAIAAGYATQNPAAQITRAMAPMPNGKHRPALLDIDAARKMLREVEQQPAFPATKLCNRFLALTAVRPGEARFACWDEIQGDVWEIPAARMKMPRAHRVPLSKQALEVLTVMRPLSGKNGYIFGSSTNPNRPISENAINYLLNRNGFQGKHCAHGWRSLFSTHMNENPVDLGGVSTRDAVEHALAHAPNNAVAAAYNRGTLFEARRVLMQHWSDILLGGALPLADILTGPRR